MDAFSNRDFNLNSPYCGKLALSVHLYCQTLISYQISSIHSNLIERFLSIHLKTHMIVSPSPNHSFHKFLTGQPKISFTEKFTCLLTLQSKFSSHVLSFWWIILITCSHYIQHSDISTTVFQLCTGPKYLQPKLSGAMHYIPRYTAQPQLNLHFWPSYSGSCHQECRISNFITRKHVHCIFYFYFSCMKQIFELHS